MNPKSNFKDYIHPIVTTLELGYLATHNSQNNTQNYWNHSKELPENKK